MSKNTIQREARFRQLMDELSGETVKPIEECVEEEKKSRARDRAFDAKFIQAIRDDAVLMDDLRARILLAVDSFGPESCPTTRNILRDAINGTDGGLGHLQNTHVRHVMKEALSALQAEGVLKAWKSRRVANLFLPLFI